MIDQDKIILMTKIAQYEKNHLNKDRRIVNYFIEDYVYINNFKTRLGITLITLFFMGVGAFRIVVENIILPTSALELFNVYIKDYFYPWLILIILYTMISTLVYGRRYTKVNRRMKQYKKQIRKLRHYEKECVRTGEATDEI